MMMKEKVDPILVAVLDSRLDAIPEEMARTLERTSRSPIFSEARDFVTSIFTRDLRLIAQKEYQPQLAGALPIAIRNIAKSYEGDINPGDVFIHNDPYGGNNHSADINIVKPVFHNGELAFWTATKGHQADIGGGGVCGYNPTGTTVWDDGIVIPASKLYERGKLNRGLWETILKNVKIPEIVGGDLMCMVGGATVGERSFLTLIDKYGLETLDAAIDEIIAATEREIRDRIRQIPNGVYYGEKLQDYDSVGLRDNAARVRCKITKEGDEITVDLSDSDPQVRGYTNSSWANTYSCCNLAIFFALPGGNVKVNEGSLRPINVITRKGTCVDPEFPAPVAMCTVSTASYIMEAIWLALSNAIPQWITSGHGAVNCGAFIGFNSRTKRRYAFFDFLCCPTTGSGTEGYDGWHCGGPTMVLGQVKTPDVEIYELIYPMRVIQHEHLIDSAAAGKFRSGVEKVYRMQWLEAFDAGVLFGWGFNAHSVPAGLFGGKSAKPAKLLVRQADGEVKEYHDTNIFIGSKTGDIWDYTFMTGGGFGDPFERDPERVREDVRNELVSLEKAKEEYGVVIKPVTIKVDALATEDLRKGRKK
jgi:N-methylhydantoinase B